MAYYKEKHDNMLYVEVSADIWFDDKFAALSVEAKLMFLYMLTTRYTNEDKVFVFSKEYVIVEMNIIFKNQICFSEEHFQELLNKEMILYYLEPNTRNLWMAEIVDVRRYGRHKHCKPPIQVDGKTMKCQTML